MVRKIWNNIYFQLFKDDKNKPLCVCRAKAIALDQSETEKENINGTIEDFFPLMGSILDLISEPSYGGSKIDYIICWADDTIKDETKIWKKLVGVRFLESIDSIGTCEKERYRGRFTAKKFIG